MSIFNEKNFAKQSIKNILGDMDNKIKEFVGDADQADDITMLAFRVGNGSRKEITIDAEISKINLVTDFVNEELDLYYQVSFQTLYRAYLKPFLN